MSAHIIDSAFFADFFGSSEMRAVFDDRNLLQKWRSYWRAWLGTIAIRPWREERTGSKPCR